MKISITKLKQYESRLGRFEEDPEKIIQNIKKILEMGCTNNDGTWIVNPPIAESQKVTFYEFVKYFGNHLVDRALENGWEVNKYISEINVLRIEERIREIGGFSDKSLPEGIIIKYR